jgi:RHS repeat-associated protein
MDPDDAFMFCALAENTWQIVETYRYDAFGAPTTRDGAGNPRSASAINNRFMFTGREYAPGSLGFYEYRARAYHPALGRFMSADPIDFGGRETNLFRYVGNDPVNRTDPIGLQAPNAKYQTEMLSAGGEATVERQIVNGTEVPTSGDSIGLSPGIGGDGVGGAGDSGGGNDGGGGGGSSPTPPKKPKPSPTPPTPTPTPTPSPTPTPTPTPSPFPGIHAPWDWLRYFLPPTAPNDQNPWDYAGN